MTAFGRGLVESALQAVAIARGEMEPAMMFRPPIGRSTWKRAVACAFDAAGDYDSTANIQSLAAERLAARIAAQALAAEPRILEIGCGTGLLTAALRRSHPDAELIATDVAPAMARRCRARLSGDPALSLVAMDGERPSLAPGFDLIASNLAAQWFEDLPGALSRLCDLLAPRGLLAVTTLASGTFGEWREAHLAEGLEAATPPYPTLGEVKALRFAGCAAQASSELLAEAHADGRAFLRALRAIGAHTPGADRPLSAGALRRALRRFEAGGARVTYEVATILVRKAG